MPGKHCTTESIHAALCLRDTGRGGCGSRALTEKALWESRVLMSRLPLRRVRRRLCADSSMMSRTARNSDASEPLSGACAKPAQTNHHSENRLSRCCLFWGSLLSLPM